LDQKPLGIASILFFLVSLTLVAFDSKAAPGAGPGAGGLVQLDTSIEERFKNLDGKIVADVDILGLVRTKGQAVHWLMKTNSGKVFSSHQLAVDIQTLYNTANLYDINVQAGALADGRVLVRVTVSDKWTLLPFAGVQGGGGSLTVGGGIYDTNLLGYFINAIFNGYVYNGAFSYDINLYQEYVAGTETMAMVDLSDNINPAIIHNDNGEAAGSYAWQRRQQEVMVGTHLLGQDVGGLINGSLVRALLYIDYFQDSIRDVQGVNAFVLEGRQYRLHPKLIFGRVNLINYLEEGQEFTVQGQFNNPLGGEVVPYQGFEISYKAVMNINNRDNWAYFIDGGVMNSVPPPYEYTLGGYYNVRGFIDNRQIGHDMVHGSLEYRPLLFERNIPFFFDVGRVVVQGCIFTDGGSAWGDSVLTGDQALEKPRLLWSAGLGLRGNFLHFAGATVRLDVARTIQPDEGWGIAFGVGQFF
jgi:hypothetical protein